MNMTDEQIKIKVAEALGFRNIRMGLNGFTLLGTKNKSRIEIPNYPGNLNACVEFEKTLNTDEQHAYWCHIVNLCNEVALKQKKFDLVGIFYKFTATASQRCLAYLKTKGIIP